MSQANALEQLMLELINEERAAAGAPPLRFNNDLNEASEDHSDWMLATDTFSHTGQGGSSAGDRIEQAGYELEGNWTWGENIAWQSERGAPGLEDDVRDLHESLMNSPGHRANILNPEYEEIGIGVERGDFGRFDSVMVTQNFGTTDATPSPAIPPAPTPEPPTPPATTPEPPAPTAPTPEPAAPPVVDNTPEPPTNTPPTNTPPSIPVEQPSVPAAPPWAPIAPSAPTTFPTLASLLQDVFVFTPAPAPTPALPSLLDLFANFTAFTVPTFTPQPPAPIPSAAPDLLDLGELTLSGGLYSGLDTGA